jgi:hypothetical protein
LGDKIKIIFQFCLLVVFSLAATEIVYSCSCVQFSHTEEIEKTDVIFAGQVIEITGDATYAASKSENASPVSPRRDKAEKRYLVKFKVETSFKGSGGGEITLVQYEYEKPVPCGEMRFTKGKKYLVYARKWKDELSGGDLCSRTRSFNKKSKDYKELPEFSSKSKNKRLS